MPIFIRISIYYLNLLFSLFVMLGVSLSSASIYAQNCVGNNAPESTPNSRFDNSIHPLAHDSYRNITWDACSLGQTVTAQGCSGSPTAYTWEGAIGAAKNHERTIVINLGGGDGEITYSNWRLPNIKELKSIVESCAHDPAINLSVFPSVSSGNSEYWSSTPYAGSSGSAWYVHFQSGLITTRTKNSSVFVRLVRDD